MTYIPAILYVIIFTLANHIAFRVFHIYHFPIQMFNRILVSRVYKRS